MQDARIDPAWRQGMKSWACAVAILGLAAVAVADVKTPIPEDEFTMEAAKAAMDQAAFKTEIDSDGDLKVADGSVVAYLRLDAERKLVSLFVIYRIKASATEIERLRLINRLNDKVILVRFSNPDEFKLWCDYQFYYEGGITPFMLVNNFRNFVRVTRLAVSQHDTEDIVGSD
jgi:hypothetical protein